MPCFALFHHGNTPLVSGQHVEYCLSEKFFWGGLLSISIYTKLGVPPQNQTDIIKSDKFIEEIIFFSMIFSFWLYMYILIFQCLYVLTLNYVK